MALNRQPNGVEKHLNFSPKVFDPVSKTYKPIYIPPDATDKVQGDVVLSDAVNGTEDAAIGMTAATPKAVKAVNDNAETKVSKIVTEAQSIVSDLNITGKVTSNTANPGFIGNLKGNVTGNADSATKLQTKRNISIKAGAAVDAVGSASFNGESDITITIPKIDFGSIGVSGIIPVENLPQGALERLIHVADEETRFALTDSNVQLGDTVLQDDTGVMYIVIDITKLNSTDGYQEYKAGTSLKAASADVATKIGTATIGSTTQPVYISGGTPTALDSIIGADNKFIYMNNGNLVASAASIGSNTQPIYIENGELKVFPTIIPTDAKFTDTTYEVFKAASSTVDGSIGLVPIPTAGAKRFLTSEGKWDAMDSFDELHVNKIIGSGTTLDYTKEFGVVAVQADEPTDPSIKIWIKS